MGTAAQVLQRLGRVFGPGDQVRLIKRAPPPERDGNKCQGVAVLKIRVAAQPGRIYRPFQQQPGHLFVRATLFKLDRDLE